MSFVPAHATVAAEGAQPSRWMLVLHGLLGSGANWRSFARRVTEACPSWGLLLVDLRMHGASLGAPPPHTVGAAAGDLAVLVEHVGVPVRGVLGHSFGGKVALGYAAEAASRGSLLDQLWLLDSGPGSRAGLANGDAPRAAPDAGLEPPSEGISSVMHFLHALPRSLPSRERFFELAAQAGLSHAVAAWLAMQLRRGEAGFCLRVDLRAIDALLEDYLRLDAWPLLDRPLARELHVVLGGRSTATGADRARLERLGDPPAAGDSAGGPDAAATVRTFVHVLPGAGHWVHADDPDGLFAVVREALAG